MTDVQTPPASSNSLEAVARRLAHAGQAAEPGIIDSYRFPSDTEIRLVHLDQNSPASNEGDSVAPFYFGPARREGIPYPSAIALIRLEEKGRLPLPEGWGTWEAAERIPREEG